MTIEAQDVHLGGRPIAPRHLVEIGTGWELIGSRCGDCDEVAFGDCHRWCPRCGSDRIQLVSLPKQGELWSCTVVRHRPAGNCRLPDDAIPLAVGMVELPEVGLRVISPLSVPPERLVIGMQLHLQVRRLYDDNDGPVISFEFGEVAGEQ
jgi:uncharacterized protein